MKTSAQGTRAKFCLFLLMCLALAACKPGANAGRDQASAGGVGGDGEVNSELCRKYDACGCESYEDCMKNAAKAPDLDKPGIRECMLKSSCESLCLGFPDGCVKQGGGAQPGAGGTGGGGQQRSNCAAIKCSKNSDCPSDCYGGCDGVICYSF